MTVIMQRNHVAICDWCWLQSNEPVLSHERISLLYSRRKLWPRPWVPPPQILMPPNNSSTRGVVRPRLISKSSRAGKSLPLARQTIDEDGEAHSCDSALVDLCRANRHHGGSFLGGLRLGRPRSLPSLLTSPDQIRAFSSFVVSTY